MKKILGILLAALMLLTLLPVTALADGKVPVEAEYYDTYINGLPVLVSETDVYGDGTVIYTPATGKSPAKLTLNGANLTNSRQLEPPQDFYQEMSLEEREQPLRPIADYAEYNIYAAEPLEIEAVGKSKVKTIYTADSCDLTISGTGTLTVEAPRPGYAAINAIRSGGDLTIEGSVDVTAKCDGRLAAIVVTDDLTINTNGTVIADARDLGEGQKNAIYAGHNITIKGSSKVEAYSDPGDAIYAGNDLAIEGSADVTASCNGVYAAVYAEQDITINTRGTVTIDARGSGEYDEINSGNTGSSCALSASYGDMVIANGTVNVYASNNDAIYAGKSITIKGTANVTATCNGFYDFPSDSGYPAIYAYYGDITISTLGTVTADARNNGRGYPTAPAIAAYGDINITSGKVKAYAENNDAIYTYRDLTISGTASVEAYNDSYTCIWASKNITLNTIGSITAESSESSALGCNGNLKINNVGKLLLRGGYNYESAYIGALELYKAGALELADGLTFYGSALEGAAESKINGKVKAELVSSSGCYTVCLENGSPANALLLKGNDGSQVVNLVKAVGAGVATIAAVRAVTHVAKMVAGNAAPLMFATGIIRTLSRLMFPF